MTKRNLILISKIIFFYSIFYMIMKLIAVMRGAWWEANLILSLPYLIFTLIGAYMLKTGKYYWAYVIAGIIVISLVRYYEKEWMLALHQYFS